ncbi:MAG: hypothetical protein R2851_23190 [Caldilineaceae bacterium]
MMNESMSLAARRTPGRQRQLPLNPTICSPAHCRTALAELRTLLDDLRL